MMHDSAVVDSPAPAERHSNINGRNSEYPEQSRMSLWRYAAKIALASMDADERRLLSLGYRQEIKRIFNEFTNFGLTASMISVVLGIIPLYTFELSAGGPVVMFWSWVIVGVFTIGLVMSLGEICCTYPTMGALYFWAYKLGGDEYGPFASWIAGWCNLLGQVAGVASGAFAGAQVLSELITICGGTTHQTDVFLYYIAILCFAGFVNMNSEWVLTSLCYVSLIWQIAGVLCIVISMLISAPSLQTPDFVFFSYNESIGFPDQTVYVALVGSLAAASAFTGYDTAAHVAEETLVAHTSTPKAMLYAVYNAIALGLVLIVGMNFCIPGDVDSFLNSVRDDDTGSQQAYTLLWRSTVGKTGAIAFLLFTLIAIECSNCANLTSATRMVYAFARDNALPFSKFLYNIDPKFGGPVRAMWLAIFVALLLGLPSLWSSVVLEALFSLTATGLYASYIVPIFLRVTVARNSFPQKEFSLGPWSVPIGCVSVCWGAFMVVVLCLPQSSPIDTAVNLNYSGVALAAVLLYAIVTWNLSAKDWYKVSLYRDDVTTSADSSLEARKNEQLRQLQVGPELINPMNQDSHRENIPASVSASASAGLAAAAAGEPGPLASSFQRTNTRAIDLTARPSMAATSDDNSSTAGGVRASFEVYSIA